MIHYRLIAYGIAALLVVGYIAKERIQAKQLQETRSALKTATATIVAERENTRKANEASDRYQADLNRLSTERSKPLSVRLCRSARVQPPGAPGGPDAASAGHVGEAAAGDSGSIPGPDIGDQLLNYAIDAEANMLQLERLQQWVRERG